MASFSSFPGCCSARVLFGLGGKVPHSDDSVDTTYTGYNQTFNDNFEFLRRLIDDEDRCKTPRHTRISSMGLITAVTVPSQNKAEEHLKKLGFEKVFDSGYKDRYPSQPLNLWAITGRDLDTNVRKHYKMKPNPFPAKSV